MDDIDLKPELQVHLNVGASEFAKIKTNAKKKYSQALYVHCKSHFLNLCVASSCNLQLVRNMMGQVRVVSQFFEAHPKRSKVLKNSIVGILPQARHRRLLNVCQYTRPLTQQLQASEMDVVAAFDNITLLYTMLQRVRRDIVKEHDVWYRKAIVLADKVGTLPSQPRTTKLQKNRENTPADNPSDYYRRAVSVPFLEFCCGKPCVQPLPTTLASLLSSIDQLTFPNIYTAMKIAATLPVTSCSCERSISILRRLKTYLRNTMRQSRMSALAMIHVHREIPIDINRVINQFAAERPKRMRLIDILNEDPGDEKIDDVAV
ncbi:52 kDa repressor of the inhibitor of the protein kinase-like [Rhopilema esculentum]|uniref:52 kDa repressor of the inhibitor of the protein kinase-like n=1 Tax=Rhopilema esculentum TaxID=499914 RepID=UPI0031CF8E6F